MLNPKFAGKICADDPRVQGPGLGNLHILFRALGEESMRKFFAEQKVVYSRNPRQVAEWLVKGQCPIAIGVSSQLEELQRKGVGKNVLPLDAAKFAVNQLTTGWGSVSLLDRAPNPSAANVYLNWLLSRDAQQA